MITSGRSADFRRLFNPPIHAAILAILDWKRVSGTSQVAQIDGKDLILNSRGGPPKKKFTPQSHAEGPYINWMFRTYATTSEQLTYWQVFHGMLFP